MKAGRVRDQIVFWRRFPRILTHPQPRPMGQHQCVLTEAGGLGAEDWGRHGESLSEESPTRPGAVWRGINESNTTL